MAYHVNLPPDFHKDRKYPILLEWHGRGGGPETNLFPHLYQVTGHVHVGLTFPEGCRYGTAMLYATKEYAMFIRQVYEDVVSNFNGDPDYVFLGGFSAGGFMTTGPGISLMIRAGLRSRLAGVLAGGCNWMCDPRYARGVDILLWYADNDPNCSYLAKQIPDLRKHARSLTTICHVGAGHICDNDYEGPIIRRFLGLHGPNRTDFALLYEIADRSSFKKDIETLYAIASKKNHAYPLASQLLSRAVQEIESDIKELLRGDSTGSSTEEFYRMLSKYSSVPPARSVIENALRLTRIQFQQRGRTISLHLSAPTTPNAQKHAE